MDQHEQHEVVGAHEGQDGSHEGGERVGADVAGLVPQKQAREEQGRSGREVGIGQEAHEGKEPGEEVLAVGGRPTGEREEQASEPPAQADEEERRQSVGGAHPRSLEPLVGDDEEAQGGHDSEEAVGQEQVPASQSAAQGSHEPPLEVDESGGVIAQDRLVGEQERAVLRLLRVAQVVVEVVDEVEGAEEGLPGGRVDRVDDPRARGEAYDQEAGQDDRPQTFAQGRAASRMRSRRVSSFSSRARR